MGRKHSVEPGVYGGVAVAVALGALVVALVWWRLNELFLVSVREGKVLVVRGAVPGPLLREIRDVVSRAGVRRASIRAVRGSTHARLDASGVDARVQQQLRNVFGLYPVQKLRAAKPLDRKNIGQLLGFAWLAWLFARY
jgi:uncharacterized protein DUF3634